MASTLATDEKRQNVSIEKYVKDVEVITEANKDIKTRRKKCPKKRHHGDYITLANFRENPSQYFKGQYKNIQELPKLLESMADLTVYILVQETPSEKKRTGSGFIQTIRRESSKSCPCRECDEKTRREFAILTVTTVLHVLDTDCHKANKYEVSCNVKRAQMKLFYDQEDDNVDSLTSLYGHRLLETDTESDVDNDWCAIEYVTHDMELVAKLENTLKFYMDMQKTVYKAMTSITNLDKKVIIVGHPHGGPKKISIGECNEDKSEVLKSVRNSQRWCRYNYDIITCGGSGGSPIFIYGQPLCGFGYWFGHPHNHSKGATEEKKGFSSIGVEHIQ